MAQQAYEYLSQTSARPQMPRRRRSSASTAGDSTGLQQLSTLSLSSSPLSSSDGSAPPSLIFSSNSPSPSSSLSSSPSLGPTKRFSHSAAVPEPLSLGAPLQPNTVELAKYASDIIRNEAYALLALAARLAPAAYPLLDDDGAHVVRATDSSSSAGTDSSDDGCEESDDAAYAKSPVDPASHVDESRTNQAFRNVVTLIQSMPRHGKILISGIGKSGIVARKMVATFCSLGIQAAFLHPVEALHGDLGLICSCSPASPCDTVFLISHSGATAELMRLLPIVRPRVRSLIAVTRDPDSVLASSCHGWLDAGTGVNRSGLPKATTDEADSALPAPTSSVVSALAIGDALALTLSRLRTGWDADSKRRREDFYYCHPGGQLGIQLGREGRGVDLPSSATSPTSGNKLQPAVRLAPAA